MSQTKQKIKIAFAQAELERHLQEQLQFLREACKKYDEGNTSYGRMIALHLRVLLHHKGSSKALFEQVGLRALLFYNTGHPVNPRNRMSTTALVAMSPAGCIPLCLTPFLEDGERIPFAKWWAQIVIVDSKRREFSREGLILHIADTDGGAHVDPGLEEAYRDLSRNGSVGWQISRGDLQEPLLGFELASARQIAYEVLRTYDERYKPFEFYGKTEIKFIF